MTSVFISYSRRDIEIARRLAESLQALEIAYWIDWKGIPPSVDWRREIQKGIEEADAFLFLLSPDSAVSAVCMEELDCAVQNGKRLIPIVVRDVGREERPASLKPLNFIFLREQDPFESAIPSVIAAIQTDFAWVQVHRQMQVKALEWERNQHENSFLLHGRELEDAETELVANTGKEPLPTALQREYIIKSRQVDDRQRRRTTSLAVAAAVLMAGLAVFGFVQARLANERAILALARQLSAQAQSLLGNGPERETTAVLLAAQSMHLIPSGEAAQVMQDHTLPRQVAVFRHEDEVSDIALSADGRLVVSGSWDGTVAVWEVASGREILRASHGEGVLAVAFSPDGTYVVSAGGGTTHFWEVPTGREIDRRTYEDLVTTIDISPDGKHLVTGAGYTAQVWEMATGREVALVAHDDYITSVVFSPDGKSVASASYDGAVRVWETITGKTISSMKHGGGECPVVFSKDGKYIVGGGGDNLVYVWEASSGELIAEMQHQGIVNSVAVSPDGRYVISAGAITAQVWDVATREEISRWTHDNDVYSVAFSPDGKYVASASYDGTARVWDPRTGQEISRMVQDASLRSIAFSTDGKYVVSGGCHEREQNGDCVGGIVRVWAASSSKALTTVYDAGTVFKLAFSPDSKWTASAVCLRFETGSGCVESSVRVWNVATGRETAHLKHQDSIDALAFTPDGKYVLAAGKRTARTWEASSGRDIVRVDFRDASVSSAFSPDGSRLVSGSQQGTIRMWDAATGRELARMEHEGGLKFLVYSPDGKSILSAGGKTIRVWEASSGLEIAHMDHDRDVYWAAFGPDGSRIVSISLQGTAQVWDAYTGGELFRLEHGRQVQSVTLSPDGKYVVSTGCDVAETGFSFNCPRAVARVWEISTGVPIASVIHDDVPLAVAFSPDGVYVATVGCARWDPELNCIRSSARVWEAVSGREIARMTHDTLLVAVAFSPDDRYIATGSEGSAQIWSWQPNDVIFTACSYVSRSLSRVEWDQYIGEALPYPRKPEEAVCPLLPLDQEATATPGSTSPPVP